jgi:hypothetical protein
MGRRGFVPSPRWRPSLVPRRHESASWAHRDATVPPHRFQRRLLEPGRSRRSAVRRAYLKRGAPSPRHRARLARAAFPRALPRARLSRAPAGERSRRFRKCALAVHRAAPQGRTAWRWQARHDRPPAQVVADDGAPMRFSSGQHQTGRTRGGLGLGTRSNVRSRERARE